MKTPKLSEVKDESLSLAARLGGIAIPHVLQKIVIKKSGLLYSLAFTALGIIVSLVGPAKLKAKEMGQGVAIYGIVTTLNELSKDTVNLGLGNATPYSLQGLSLPEAVRTAIKSYIPNLSGTSSFTLYPAGYRIPGDEPMPKLNGIPSAIQTDMSARTPSTIQMGGLSIQS
jgi:hypothetical protein